ncbi:hypothetical protein Tco_0128589 [Tanacetum coccineum]
MSPGNVAREGIPFELFRSTYPGRHVARERYPQRQVARDTPDLSLGNIANVVVTLSSASACFHRLSRIIREVFCEDGFFWEAKHQFEISSWRGARVDVRTYLLGGAIDGSEANGIIRNPKLELESSRFTFDLVPLSYESVDVIVGENWLLRHKAEMVNLARWSMKKDIASCGSKYLAYSEVEVKYQGSSGLLLQPELPE